jgi:hypothetical protein
MISKWWLVEFLLIIAGICVTGQQFCMFIPTSSLITMTNPWLQQAFCYINRLLVWNNIANLITVLVFPAAVTYCTINSVLML